MAVPLSARAAARYRALFETAADPILVADGAGRYVDANSAALTLLGYTLEELLRLHIGDVSARAPEALQAEYSRLKRDHEWWGESTFRRKDGSLFPVEIRASQADLSEGSLYFAAFRDITERKRAEEQLLETEARYRTLVHATANTVWRFSGDGEHLLEAQGGLIAPYAVENGPTSDWLARYLHPEDQQAERLAWRQAVQTQGDFHFRQRVRSRDGSYRWIEGTTVPVVDEQGGVREWIGSSIDISERLADEEALRHSEERMRLALQIGTGGTWDYDLISDISIWSASHFALLGYEPQPDGRATVALWRARLHDDDAEMVLAEWQRSEQAHDDYRCQYRIHRADTGEIRWLDACGRFFYDNADETVRFIGVFFDITERKRIDEQLRESEERYRTLVHALASSVWRMSGDGERLLDLQGGFVAPYDVGQEPSAAWIALYTHPEDQEATVAAWRHAITTRSAYNHVNRLRSATGDYRWVRARAVPIWDQGVVREWIGVNFDITDRLQAEATNARLAAIIESSQDAVLTETLDGIILDWNPGAEALYGYTAAEAVGRHVSFLVAPESANEPEQSFARLRRGELAPPFETVRLRKDGTRVAVEVRLSAIRDAAGRIIAISAIVRDITERKRLEQLRQDVLAMASHDLRTPLAVVSMRAQLLRSRQVYDEHGVEIIQEQTRQMARLVDDLWDAVRLEAGQIELWPEALDLNVVAQKAVERAQTQTDEHPIHLQPAATPVVGAWDQIRLEEILDNLLGNAIKYSPAGGEIIVRVTSTETEAWLSVADQGVGIPAETLTRLFERFHRGEGTGTVGLGLGLYIARMLVEAHHGRIDVQSVPGGGSIFTVRLPLTDTAKIASDLASQPLVPQEMTEAAPIRVLIADDHAMVREGLRLLLTQDPAIVVVGESATGREAVRLAHELHPDVVLMDRLMPEMDGLAATTAIRQEVPGTAVLMVSGVPREYGAEEARRAGAVGYLRKDADAEEMRRAVRAASAGRA